MRPAYRAGNAHWMQTFSAHTRAAFWDAWPRGRGAQTTGVAKQAPTMNRSLRVAAVQLRAHDRAVFTKTLPSILDQIAEAANGAELVVVPEGTFPAYVLGSEPVDRGAIETAVEALRDRGAPNANRPRRGRRDRRRGAAAQRRAGYRSRRHGCRPRRQALSLAFRPAMVRSRRLRRAGADLDWNAGGVRVRGRPHPDDRSRAGRPRRGDSRDADGLGDERTESRFPRERAGRSAGSRAGTRKRRSVRRRQ